MAKDWTYVRIEPQLRDELEAVRRVYLKPHAGRLVPVERDSRGRVSLSQVIARLVAERRRRLEAQARSRARLKARREAARAGQAAPFTG